MALKGLIIFVILIIKFVAAVRWTWDDVQSKLFVLQGRAGAVSGRPPVHRCSAWCMDASACWGNSCHYDLATLHCYDPATSERVHYNGYNPVWKSESECVNIGGGAVTGQFGYQFSADPQTSFLLSFFKLSTYSGIAGAGADQPIYQTARTASKHPIQYYLRFVGDRYFLCRFMFAEIGGKRRNFNVVLNNAYTLKSNFDVAGTSGYNSAYAFYITVKGQNGNTQIVYNGQATGLQSGGLALLSVHKNGWLSTGILNGFCGTRFPPCTEHCNNPDTCNSRSECYYDFKISHCVQASFRPTAPPGPPTTPAPPSPPVTTPTTKRPTKPPVVDKCGPIGADRDTCEAKGCLFCCNLMTCVRIGAKKPPNCYNGGCIGDCFRPDACNSRPNHCQYDEDTGRCIDCTYVKLQVAFLVDTASQSAVNSFKELSKLATSLKKMFRDPEFAITSYADWERTAWSSVIGHNDPDNCYRVVQKFTPDDAKIVSVASKMTATQSSIRENGDTGLVWTSASKELGWKRERMIADGRQVIRLMILVDNKFLNPEGRLGINGSRTVSKGDGTDTCRNNLPVTRKLLRDVLVRDMMSVIGFFTVDEIKDVIVQWDDLFAGMMEVLYSSFESTAPLEDLASYIRAFVAGQNMNDMCATMGSGD